MDYSVGIYVNIIRHPKASSRLQSKKHKKYLYRIFCTNNVAEGKGFEPSVQFYPYTHLAGELLRPLGHPSLCIIKNSTGSLYLDLTRKSTAFYRITPCHSSDTYHYATLRRSARQIGIFRYILYTLLHNLSSHCLSCVEIHVFV